MNGRRLVFKVLGVIAGLVFIGAGVSQRQSLSKMKRIGQVAVVAPITDYTERRSRGSTTYSAEIQFKTEEGREIKQRHSFPAEALPDFKSGTPVKVLYDPQNPHEFVFEKEQASWMMPLGGVAFVIAALVLL